MLCAWLSNRICIPRIDNFEPGQTLNHIVLFPKYYLNTVSSIIGPLHIFLEDRPESKISFQSPLGSFFFPGWFIFPRESGNVPPVAIQFQNKLNFNISVK